MAARRTVAENLDSKSSRPLRVVFMGTPPFAATCLDALLASRHRLVAVVTRIDKPSGRGQKLVESPVKKLALRANLPVLQPKSAKKPEFVEQLNALDADIGVVVAYGRILPNEVFENIRLGCINAHASLLPKYRGAAPIERAIIAGEKETGVSIMRIEEEMDAGPVIAMKSVPIPPDGDNAYMRGVLSELSASMLIEALDQLADGSATFTPQDHDAATFAPPVEKAETEVDWSDRAFAIDCRVRAFRPKPGAFSFLGGKRVKIVSAKLDESAPEAKKESTDTLPGSIVEIDGPIIVVACGHSESIRIERLQPEGKREMDAADFIRGIRGGQELRFGPSGHTT